MQSAASGGVATPPAEKDDVDALVEARHGGRSGASAASNQAAARIDLVRQDDAQILDPVILLDDDVPGACLEGALDGRVHVQGHQPRLRSKSMPADATSIQRTRPEMPSMSTLRKTFTAAVYHAGMDASRPDDSRLRNSPPEGRGSRRTALVTGASAGIGAAFARLLAREGMDLVLVARRADRLEALAKELREACGVQARVLAADLADPDAAQQIQEMLERDGVSVDVLVNNAGYGLKKGFSEASWQEHASFLQVMATSVTELCHLFVPGMKARGWGRVVNVASVAAFTPQVPGNLYGGVKGYVVDFSEALALELKGTGVHVCALCPGYTLTEFHDVMDVRNQIDALPRFVVMSADVVARQGWQAVERGQAVCVNGWLYRAIVAVCRHTPTFLLRSLSQRSVLRPKRDE